MSTVDLVITKTFDASPERVFNAWTNAKDIATWYGPEGFTNEVDAFDAKVGGAYRVAMHAPDGAVHTVVGTFKTIEPHTKLVLTWQWEGAPGAMGAETLVTVEFKDVGGKTEMTMTHSGFPDDETKQSHNMGWSSSFNKLERVFT